jgi:hypothetical protein
MEVLSPLDIASNGEVACGPTGAPGAPGDIAKRGPLKARGALETGDFPPPHPDIITSSINTIKQKTNLLMPSSVFILFPLNP